MVDTFSILLTHGLLVIALWRMAHNDEIDVEAPPESDKNPSGFFNNDVSNRHKN